MEIGERRQANLLVLAPVGRIDNLTSTEFQARLLAALTSSPADVIVDFSRVEYISSAGLRALMAGTRLKPKERRLAVACLHTVVREIFAISRFSHVVPVFDTVEEASTAWEAPPRPEGAIPNGQTEPVGPLRVRFWGTRGSLPAPLPERAVRLKIRDALLAARGHALDTEQAIDAFIDSRLPFSVRGTFGGNTSCVEIVTGGDEYVICDLGTGVREFGNRVLQEHGPGRKHIYNIFLSHPHWDHIMGFPFFAPAYIPGNRICIYGCHGALREALRTQHSAPWFPVDFHTLGSTIEFIPLEPSQTYEIAGLSVSSIKQFHTGDSYGFRFSQRGRSIVYSTDGEHKNSPLDETYPFVEFYRNADMLIFDAMYSLGDSVSVKEDWGHSSNVIAVELAQAARVRRLVLFHHEPAYDDRMLEEIFADTVRFEAISRPSHEVPANGVRAHGVPARQVEVISAYDGLELEL